MDRKIEARTLWEKVSGNLQEWYSDAMGWTEEKARIGAKKVDIVGIQHNIKRSMTHLGGRVYDLMERHQQIEKDDQVLALVGTIRKLEAELAERENEIESLKGGRKKDDATSEVTQVEASPVPDHAPASKTGSDSTGGDE